MLKKETLTSIYKEELFNAKRALFIAGSVKNVKMLQDRIRFLDEKIKQHEAN